MGIIEDMLGRWAKMQEKYPVLILLISITIISYFGYWATNIETDSSFDVMFSKDSNTIINKKLVANEFGSNDLFFTVIRIDPESNDKTGVKDIRDPRVFSAISSLSTSLRAESSVAEVNSINTVFEAVYGRLPSTLDESIQMLENLPEEAKEYVPIFLNSDFTHTNVILDVNINNKPGSLQKVEGMIREKMTENPLPSGAVSDVTGLSILLNRIMVFLIRDNITTIGIAILGILFILWIYFRAIHKALVSVVPVIFTLILLAGVMVLNEIRVTVMIASVGAMIVGMSVDYSIHITHSYNDKTRRGEKDPMFKTLTTVGSALLASALTTFAGFGAMWFGGTTPNSTTQGQVLALGIAFAFIVTIIILPPLLILERRFFSNRNVRSENKRDEQKEPSKILLALANIQTNRPKMVIATVFLITLLIVPGFALVSLDVEGKNWLPEDDSSIDTFIELGNNFGGTETLNLLFILDKPNKASISDLRDPEALEAIDKVSMLVESLPWVDLVDSPSNDIKNIRGRIPLDIEKTKRIIDETPGFKSSFNEDYTIAKVTIRADGIGEGRFRDMMDEVSSISLPEGVSIVPQGDTPEDMEMSEMITKDTSRTTLIGFFFVIATASIFYLSITIGILAFIPVIFAILWTIGMMGYINLPFTILTTGMLAILMGMGIDFSIHLIHSIRDNIKRYSIKRAVANALTETGSAISMATLTTVTGFIALSFASLVNTRRLGWTLALGIFMTFFSSMLIVPAVMTLRLRMKKNKEKNQKIFNKENNTPGG